MALRDVFKKAFWSARLDDICDGCDKLYKATLDGLIMHGRATAGLPPFDPPIEQEQAKPAAPAAEKKPQQPAGPG